MASTRSKDNATTNLFLTQKRNLGHLQTRAMSNEKDDRFPRNQTNYDKYQMNLDVNMTDRKGGFVKRFG